MSVTHCDFCHDPSPKFTYPCRDFGLVIPGHATHTSRGPWFACVACSDMVEACDHAGLLHRAVQATLDAMPEKIANIRESAKALMVIEAYLGKLQDAFFLGRDSRHKIGPGDLFEAHVDQSVVASEKAKQEQLKQEKSKQEKSKQEKEASRVM